MEASVIDTVAKFFYLSSLNEQLTFSASLRVLSDLRSQGFLEEKHRAHWVEALIKWKSKLKSMPKRSWSDSSHEEGFTMPEDFDINSWLNFSSLNDATEVEAVLLSSILGFSVKEIADGLSVTEGTVRYRLGRGLRQLGKYVES